MPIAILSVMEQLSISSFSKGRHPVCLQTENCVKDALKTFNTQKVTSCPIANNVQKSNVHGFLDLFDLLSYLLDLWDENNETENDLKNLGERFLNHNITDLMDRSDNDSFVAVVGEEHAHRLIRLFGMGVHRVAILDLQGSLSNVLSQSDVLKYLNANINLFGENANKTIEELKMITTDNLIIAEADQTAISAYKLLAEHLISAVPIVDKRGVLAGTLSLSDLKFIQDDLSPLLLTTLQYKAIQEPVPNVVVTRSSTLVEVVSLLANSNVHRVWVVDDNNKPVSVISTTNVCEFLTQFLPNEDEN